MFIKSEHSVFSNTFKKTIQCVFKNKLKLNVFNNCLSFKRVIYITSPSHCMWHFVFCVKSQLCHLVESAGAIEGCQLESDADLMLIRSHLIHYAAAGEAIRSIMQRLLQQIVYADT